MLALVAAFAFANEAPARTGTDAACGVGLYQFGDGRQVDIGNSDEERLRWRTWEGRTGSLTETTPGHWTSRLGWTERSDGIDVRFDCPAGTLRFDGKEGRRVGLRTLDTRFQGAGVALAGRLVMPPGDGPVPVVVLVHGSEDFSALEFYAHQRLFPGQGIGVFVYDKRGTGKSGGQYTHDYLLLANDAIAAAREARRLAGDRATRVGYLGTSQGGWTAPLAARIEPVDFVIASYGLAVSPLDEDREAIVYDMARQGHGPEIVAHAMEVADATAAVMLNGFRGGYERIEAVRAKYGDEPWFPHVRGNITGHLLDMPEATLRAQGPVLLDGIPLQYDPMPVLRNLDVPQLWVLAADDRAAPIGETLRRLARLQAAGRPITTAVFAGTDHGIYQYEQTADGDRVSTRNPEGYLRLLADFIRDGQVRTYLDYGASVSVSTSAATKGDGGN
ncbi:alpha/beta hydrolase [Luteimonas viscosa]|uniref:Alpha/beta hydrolase n=1 Tax=Luteimonas viscosa TaxID=1132694 RepID=A0A5D4XQT2_9GAMM|nr:alpha/beta hydrolase [Luteimonas viscosa]TYT27006.1 alpha/beta hydrolase [Luteimonas viscosa]